jgi:hypothetical protein
MARGERGPAARLPERAATAASEATFSGLDVRFGAVAGSRCGRRCRARARVQLEPRARIAHPRVRLVRFFILVHSSNRGTRSWNGRAPSSRVRSAPAELAVPGDRQNQEACLKRGRRRRVAGTPRNASAKSGAGDPRPVQTTREIAPPPRDERTERPSVRGGRWRDRDLVACAVGCERPRPSRAAGRRLERTPRRSPALRHCEVRSNPSVSTRVPLAGSLYTWKKCSISVPSDRLLDPYRPFPRATPSDREAGHRGLSSSPFSSVIRNIPIGGPGSGAGEVSARHELQRVERVAVASGVPR